MQEIAVLLIPVFAFALLKAIVDQRAEARSERVRLLEQALQNPAIDRATIESLAYQLTGARRPRETGSSRMLAIVLAVGWIALFSGIGVWVLGVMTHSRDAGAGGLVAAIVGFGIVTYPFALRELEARRAQP